MPIYEYKCNSCKTRFEKLVSFGREKEVVCNTCESKEVERLLSKFAFSGKDKSGTITKASSSGCSSCSATSCSSCH